MTPGSDEVVIQNDLVEEVGSELVSRDLGNEDVAAG
jgi:hypothetical protein